MINPPNSGRSIPEEEYGIESIKMIFRGEPLALEVLAGNLSPHEIQIADLKVEPDRLSNYLHDFKPELVGLTGVTCEANAVLEIARKVKGHSPGTVVVVGGHHASNDPTYFNRQEVDYIVIGLGKASVRELVEVLEQGEAPRDIPGVARSTPGEPLSYAPRQYTVSDLVEDQAPRYNLVARHREHYVMSGVGGKVGFVASAFGCTHGCLFCCIPKMTAGKYLSHSVEAVLRDISLLEDIPLIRLVDANTFGDPQLAARLAQGLLDAGVNKHIVADVRADTVARHPDLFRLWKDAGLVGAVIGFEEISDGRLRGLNKQSDVATHLKAMKILNDLGIRIIADFIVSPDYMPEDFRALEDFIAANSIALPIPAILTPLPGTPLHRRLANQITIHNLDYYTFTNAVIPPAMGEGEFYAAYADLLEKCMGHLKPQADRTG